MNKRKFMRKSAIVYFCVSVLCIVITNIYALYGHAVRSLYMDYMFLYPLIGGMALLSLTAVYKKVASGLLFRIGFNLYNSGLAALTAGSMLNGIMEIAGTASEWIPFFALFGWGFAIAGITVIFIGCAKHHER
jgi:hypothetical protein